MKAETEIKPAGHREPVKKTLFVIAIDRGTNSGFIYQKTASVKATERAVLVLDGQQRKKLIEYMRGLTQANYLERKEKDRIAQLYIPTLETGQVPDNPEAMHAMISLNCNRWNIPLKLASYSDQMFAVSAMSARRNGNVSLTPRGENSQTPARKLK